MKLGKSVLIFDGKSFDVVVKAPELPPIPEKIDPISFTASFTMTPEQSRSLMVFWIMLNALQTAKRILD